MKQTFLILLLATLCGIAAPAHAQKLVHSERSLYREVLVYEDASERCMCFTRQCRIGRQSCLNLQNPRQFALNYTRMMMAGSAHPGDWSQGILGPPNARMITLIKPNSVLNIHAHSAALATAGMMVGR